MLKNNKRSIYTSLVALFFISMAYTNCSPIHDGQTELGSITPTVCTPDLEVVNSSVNTEASCAACHNTNVPGAPQFRDVTFNQFLNVLAPSGSDVRARTVTATNRVVARLRDGDGTATHPVMATEATNLENDLITALSNFDDCEAMSAAVNE